MKRFVHILFLTFALAATCWGEDLKCVKGEGRFLWCEQQEACFYHSNCENANCEESASHSARPKDRLHHEDLSEQPQPLAILTNGQENYRLNSSRPQRLLPSYGSSKSRTPPQLPKLSNHKTTKRKHYGGRFCLLSAPFQAVVSCAYYIYALRRILR